MKLLSSPQSTKMLPGQRRFFRSAAVGHPPSADGAAWCVLLLEPTSERL